VAAAEPPSNAPCRGARGLHLTGIRRVQARVSRPRGVVYFLFRQGGYRGTDQGVFCPPLSSYIADPRFWRAARRTPILPHGVHCASCRLFSRYGRARFRATGVHAFALRTRTLSRYGRARFCATDARASSPPIRGCSGWGNGAHSARCSGASSAAGATGRRGGRFLTAWTALCLRGGGGSRRSGEQRFGGATGLPSSQRSSSAGAPCLGCCCHHGLVALRWGWDSIGAAGTAGAYCWLPGP